MPAFLLSPLIRWGLVAIVMASLLAGLVWFKHEAKLAKAEAAIAAADAARWHAASDLLDAAIVTLNTTVAGQDAKIEAARIDNTKLKTIAAQFAADMRTARDSIDAQIQETKDDARQHPDQVHRLGAVACAQYRRLYGARAACVDTEPAVAD